MPIACLALAALVAVAVSRLRWPGTAAMVCLLLLVDLRIGLFHATAADEHNRAYAALRGEPAGRLLELPVFPPGAQDASVYLYYRMQAPRAGPAGYTTTAPPRADVVSYASCAPCPALASPSSASGTSLSTSTGRIPVVASSWPATGQSPRTGSDLPRIRRVSFDDWILALHVLSAFAYVAGIVLFWVLIVAVRRIDTPDGTLRMEPLSKSATPRSASVRSGRSSSASGWPSRSADYDIWDGWIIAALVLWVVAGGARTAHRRRLHAGHDQGAGARTAGADRARAASCSRSTAPATGSCCTSLASLVVLLILIDMIWKPGA